MVEIERGRTTGAARLTSWRAGAALVRTPLLLACTDSDFVVLAFLLDRLEVRKTNDMFNACQGRAAHALSRRRFRAKMPPTR